MEPASENAYARPCPYGTVDVYRVLTLFGVTDPAIQHAIKKLLTAGRRPGGKSELRDVQEARQALDRYFEMQSENAAARGRQP